MQYLLTFFRWVGHFLIMKELAGAIGGTAIAMIAYGIYTQISALPSDVRLPLMIPVIAGVCAVAQLYAKAKSFPAVTFPALS